jgi:hypothetical protein
MRIMLGIAIGIALVYLGVTDRVLIAGKQIAAKF